jgi:cysteinyl-tRNA synthetase
LVEAKGGTRELAGAAETAELEFKAALDNDLNAPEAVAALFTFIGRANAELDRRGTDVAMLARTLQVFRLMMSILDLEPRALRFVVSANRVDPEPVAASGLNAKEVEQVGWAVMKLRERVLARQDRDFKAADGIRAEVESAGFAVKDTANGTVLERYQ